MFFFQEDLDKMKAKFRMALDIRKEQQQNVQNKIQKMKVSCTT